MTNYSLFRYQSKTAKTILDAILSIQPKDSGGGGGESRETTVYRLADDMLEKLPNDYVPFEVDRFLFWFNHMVTCRARLKCASKMHVECISILFCVTVWIFPSQVKQRLQKMGHLTPMNIFLRQELDRMQRVISTVRTTLNDLKLAIDGTIIMSETLRDALDSMYDARIPAAWQKVSL